MKAAIVLLFLALCVAINADFVCDPNGDGQPDCVGRSGEISRDFWDPTHYWKCSGTGQAELVACDPQTGFDPKTGECVDWSVWQWYPPCPETST
ncbi:uncharacterized protein LOC6527720 [Drosophila yakuba]|uniref:Chitin-binding type-2 domain-containing protein n=1 Tax=Drosophila yakuba TaxID=7245 RepID=B4NWY5_DROYA|nr:uncharacterized protein LOC6527720 [Drosophila yakuba]EDW88515.1 uncharacterized protein Dyak_GE11009 [Drosophila yakuba]